MSDERTVTELRALARSATPVMSLDPAGTVALGRRRRRRSRALTGGGAVAGVGLVLAAAVAVSGTPWGAGIEQRAAGDLTPGTSPATVITLTPGLDAVIGEVTVTDFQTDLGTLSGSQVILDRFTRASDTDPEIVQLAAFRGEDYVAGVPQDLVLGDGYGEIVATVPEGGEIRVGALPVDATYRVAAWIQDADGAVQALVEVPTFTFPVAGTAAPERQFFALGVAADLVEGLRVEVRPVTDEPAR